MNPQPLSGVIPGMQTGIERAVFLDRDGVINRPIIRDGLPFPPRSLDDFEILPDVRDACRALKNIGFLLVIVTNQPEVSRGSLSRSVVDDIHRTLKQHLPIDRIEVCFHAGARYGDGCECRKPRPGMLFRAARELSIDLAKSFVIGDRWRDVTCGRRAGCKTIFIDWGYKESLAERPDYTVSGLGEAVHFISAADH
jgi:D-glycero-D-manno-heptose 1,7-bisphosphate phosphatase